MRVVGWMLSNAGASDSERNDEFSATMGEKLNWVKRIKMVVKIKEIYRLAKLKYRCDIWLMDEILCGQKAAKPLFIGYLIEKAIAI
ncbi:hypothetical protein [Vibrio sp.]|uniref:hypothetical protein n=1 Tax=Vibrio sp. TaxID=678 RepID=UPI0037DCD3DF